MSSLGDLLLGKAHSKTSSPKSDDNDDGDKFYSVQGSQRLQKETKPKSQSESTREPPTDDVQSNASSTDDYVRELLDPNDRPRNVWHVVEGPKPSPPPPPLRSHHDDYGRRITPENEDMDISKSPKSSESRSRHDNRYMHGRDLENDIPPPPSPPPPPETIGSIEDEDVNEQGSEDRDSRGHKYDRDSRKHRDRERDRSREESPSSRRHHKRSSRDRDRHSDHDKQRDRTYDRSRDRDYKDDKDRRDRSRKSSSRRRYDISDDEDDYSRRHGSRRHHRRSRSRSRSPSRRTRKRSRSGSQSPVTRRNSRTVLLMQLNSRVTSRDIESFFSDIGPVREVRLIMDSKTRRHKGIAYIEFDDTTSAAKALALNGQKFLGAPMTIQSALTDRSKLDWGSASVPSHTSGHHSSSHSSSRGNLPPDSYRVYVGSLHPGITEDMLRSLFEPFGPILRLELMRDRSTNMSRGYAFITFANIDDGQYAVQNLDGLELGGKPIRVSKSTEKGEQSSSSHV